MTIDELINKTSEHIGSNPHLSDIFSPINIGTIFSFLYSLIVVPNELYRDDKSDFLNKFEFNINKLSNFAIDFGRYYTENFNK